MRLYIFITKNHDKLLEILRTNHRYINLLKSNIVDQIVADLNDQIGVELADFYDIPYDNSIVLANRDKWFGRIHGKWINPTESDIDEMCSMAEQISAE